MHLTIEQLETLSTQGWLVEIDADTQTVKIAKTF